MKNEKQKLDLENEKLRDKVRQLTKSNNITKQATQKLSTNKADDGSGSSDDDDDDDKPVKENLIIAADAGTTEELVFL